MDLRVCWHHSEKCWNQIFLESLLVVCNLVKQIPLILSYGTCEMKILIATSCECREQDVMEGLEPCGLMFAFILFPI